jgi:hypothetical protein
MLSFRGRERHVPIFRLVCLVRPLSIVVPSQPGVRTNLPMLSRPIHVHPANLYDTAVEFVALVKLTLFFARVLLLYFHATSSVRLISFRINASSRVDLPLHLDLPPTNFQCPTNIV